MADSASTSRGVVRLQAISRHLHPPSHFASQSPDDVVILSVARTPIGRAKRGAFKDTTPDVLLAHALRGAIERAGVRAEDVGDIRVGNVLPANGAIFARMAQFQAGIPHSVPLAAVNRQCSSGLQAVADIASAIRAGHIDVGIAAGVESMSSTGMGDAVPPFSQEAVSACAPAADCLVPMGITSENVAAKYGVTRADQDAFAARSHALAASAQREGRFTAEIVPVTLADGTVISHDEGIREATTADGLARLRCAHAPRLPSARKRSPRTKALRVRLARVVLAVPHQPHDSWSPTPTRAPAVPLSRRRAQRPQATAAR